LNIIQNLFIYLNVYTHIHTHTHTHTHTHIYMYIYIYENACDFIVFHEKSNINEIVENSFQKCKLQIVSLVLFPRYFIFKLLLNLLLLN